MKKAMIIIALLMLVGCTPTPPEITEVKCIAIHQHNGEWSDPFTYMIVERTDTRERRKFDRILGQPGDVFLMKWNRGYYGD